MARCDYKRLKDVDLWQGDLEMYSQEEVARVTELLRYQARKYSYLFAE